MHSHSNGRCFLFRDGTDLDDVQGNRGCADEVAIEVRLDDEQGVDDFILRSVRPDPKSGVE